LEKAINQKDGPIVTVFRNVRIFEQSLVLNMM